MASGVAIRRGHFVDILATFDTHDSRLSAIREASLFWGKKKGRYLSAPSNQPNEKLSLRLKGIVSKMATSAYQLRRGLLA